MGGGVAFCCLFALAGAAADDLIAVGDSAFEDAVVIGAVGVGELIVGVFWGGGLEEFLQFALGIPHGGGGFHCLQTIRELVQNDALRGVVATVDEYGSDKCFIGIGENRRAIATVVLLFSTAELNQLVEPEGSGLLGEGVAVDKFGAGLGENAFADALEFGEKFFRKDELEHCVTEKLQPLVVVARFAGVVPHRRMGEREVEVAQVVEPIVEAFLEFF